MNQLGLERVVELGAQAPHRHIDDVGVAVEVHVPHMLADQRARDDLAEVAHEVIEQRVFLRRQIDALAGAQPVVVGVVGVAGVGRRVVAAEPHFTEVAKHAHGRPAVEEPAGIRVAATVDVEARLKPEAGLQAAAEVFGAAKADAAGVEGTARE